MYVFVYVYICVGYKTFEMLEQLVSLKHKNDNKK